MLAVAVLTLRMAFCTFAILNYLLAQVRSKTGTRVPNSDIEHVQYHWNFLYTLQMTILFWLASYRFANWHKNTVNQLTTYYFFITYNPYLAYGSHQRKLF